MPDLTSLLERWARFNDSIRELEVGRHNTEQEIIAAMQADRAEFAEAPGVEATFKTSLEYEKALDGPLAVIAEELSPEELDAALTAQKPAPARSFDIRAVKKLAKRGGIFRDALDQSTREVPARLRIKATE